MEPGGTHKLCKRSVDVTNVDFAFLTVITILKSLFYLAGRRWKHEKGYWNEPLNFSVFSGAHFGENPSKSEPRRLPTGTHFLLFFMFSGPWASKGASCDLLGSRGPALGSPGARQNSNSLQKHTFYEGDFQKQPFRSRAGPRRLQKDTIPDRRHRPLGLYNIFQPHNTTHIFMHLWKFGLCD